ncbi:putative methyltransferase NSUN7 isoform X2 [Electrophorus electricus]|uniref:putative methyltransferase NSUN7 isoform X2 n=1 Tax=Electrophorus electricus TaxID=8005 RepID=UPI0015D0A466|nr:putative methyltransferase NSUN7 isoform X2 [Electrophorus electricus]
MFRDGPDTPHPSRSSSRFSKHVSHVSSFKALSLVERRREPLAPPSLQSYCPSAQPQPEAAAPGKAPDSFPDYVYLRAAAIFQSLHQEKAASHRLISYGTRSEVKVPEVKDEVLHRLAYELAFNTLKYQELLEDVMMDSCFYLFHPMANDLMSLVAVMLYDFLDRKFRPREQLANQKEGAAEPSVREVEECLFRFKTKLEASLARCRIKHHLLTIQCILPKTVQQRQERASNLPLYAWVNTLRASMEEVCDELKSAGFSRVTSVGQLEGQTFCKDPHCMDVLVFPACVREELCHNNLLSEYKLIVQDKSCCVGPWAVRPLLEVGRDVLVAGSFSASTLAHLAAIVAGAHTHAHTHTTPLSGKHTHGSARVLVCGGELSFDQKHELQEVLSSMACSNYILQESGDTELLKDLSQGVVSQARLHTLISQQRRDLQHALQFPKVQAVVYSTCSSFPEENEEVVQKALSLSELGISKRQPFRLSSPSLPQYTMCGDEDRGQSGFFKLEASDQSNGCFLAVLTRQSDPEVTETAQEVVARATTSGLLDGIQPSQPIKKQGRGRQTRKGPSFQAHGSDTRPRVSLSGQSQLAEFLSQEMKASRSAPALTQEMVNAACSLQGKKVKPTYQHSSKLAKSGTGSASCPALASSPPCKNMTRMLVNSASALNPRAPPPVAPPPCPPKSRQEVLRPVALMFPPMLFPGLPPFSVCKSQPPPQLRRNPTLSFHRWKSSLPPTNTLPHTWSSSSVRHPHPWL